MKSMRDRVRRITLELNTLREELINAEHASAEELISDILTPEVMQDFKSSVDAVRHLLWMYIEAAARARNSNDIDIAIQTLRLQRAVEMLKSLRGSSIPGATGGHASFVEHISRLVDNYTQSAKKNPAKS